MRWDRTGMIVRILKERQYEILVDGSRRVTVRNRRHLRKIEKPVEDREDEMNEMEEEDEYENDATGDPAENPTPAPTSTPEPPEPAPEMDPTPAPAVTPEPVPEVDPAPAPAPIPATDDDWTVVRRSSRQRREPERLVVKHGKTYVDTEEGRGEG